MEVCTRSGACVLVRTRVHMNDAYVLILSLGEPSLSVY